MTYQNTANELVNRFKEVIKEHPKMIKTSDPYKFINKGLKYDDLQPSLFQAMWAMREAQRQMK